MWEVETEPDSVATAIKNYLWNNDELLKGNYKDYIQHPLAGHCYVASEAYYRMLDDQEAWKPQCLVVEWNEDGYHKDMTHWYLENMEEELIVDLTAEQFNPTPTVPQYEGGIGRGFVPPSPSSRADTVIEAI